MTKTLFQWFWPWRTTSYFRVTVRYYCDGVPGSATLVPQNVYYPNDGGVCEITARHRVTVGGNYRFTHIQITGQDSTSVELDYIPQEVVLSTSAIVRFVCCLNVKLTTSATSTEER